MPNANQISAVSRLFSTAVFREMATKGHSPLFARLISQSPVQESCSSDANVADAFDAAFRVLRKGSSRDEYVYRAALTHKVLLGTHSLRTACMLNEFRAGNCKADLAILNGTATAYEIKSERDSLSRLANQIENYKKVFTKIYIIAGENHVRNVVEATPSDVGILSLSKRYQVSTVREAQDRSDQICPVTIFESLRSREARLILNDLNIPVPELPNTKMHSAMRDIFARIPPVVLHLSMVRVLKQSRDLSPLQDLVARLPNSLHAAALSVKVRKSDHERLVSATNTPLQAAMKWN